MIPFVDAYRYQADVFNTLHMDIQTSHPNVMTPMAYESGISCC